MFLLKSTHMHSTDFSEFWLQVSWQICDIIKNSFLNLNMRLDCGLFFSKDLRSQRLEVSISLLRYPALKLADENYNKIARFYLKQEKYLNIMHDFNLHTGCL